MNQLKNDEITEIDKLRFLKSFLPKEHLNAYKHDFGFDIETSFYFHVFAPFCRAYAKFLLNNGSFSCYGDFIEAFNDLIIRDPSYQLYKKTQTEFATSTGGLGFLNLNYTNALINDQRYQILDDETFKFESDLEHLISSELKDFYGEEISVKTQQYHGYGVADISINDSIAIELKKGKAKRKDVYQAFEYSFDHQIKEVGLIAASFDDDTLTIAEKLGVNCYSYCFMYEDPDIGKPYPVGFTLKKTDNTKVATQFENIVSEMDAFWISFYSPSFSFTETFEKEYRENIKIHERTLELIKHNEQHLLSLAKEQGYQNVHNLDELLQRLKEEVV